MRLIYNYIVFVVLMISGAVWGSSTFQSAYKQGILEDFKKGQEFVLHFQKGLDVSDISMSLDDQLKVTAYLVSLIKIVSDENYLYNFSHEERMAVVNQFLKKLSEINILQEIVNPSNRDYIFTRVGNPLESAIEKSNLEIVQILLNAGSDSNFVDKISGWIRKPIIFKVVQATFISKYKHGVKAEAVLNFFLKDLWTDWTVTHDNEEETILSYYLRQRYGEYNANPDTVALMVDRGVNVKEMLKGIDIMSILNEQVNDLSSVEIQNIDQPAALQAAQEIKNIIINARQRKFRFESDSIAVSALIHEKRKNVGLAVELSKL